MFGHFTTLCMKGLRVKIKNHSKIMEDILKNAQKVSTTV